jgi:hypothetical protein
VQHFSIIVASGSRTDFKQGSRLPISVATNAAPGSNAEITYIDIGQEIDASLDGYLDGVRLRTKVVQSSIAEDKSGVGTQDPVIRQTTLEGTSTLVQGKPLVLGSLDVPGSTRHQEVEVVSELVRESAARLSSLLFCLLGVAKHFFANDPLRGFVQVPVEGGLDLEKFRPQGFLDERGWSAHDHSRVTLSRVTVGFKPVPPAQGGKE